MDDAANAAAGAIVAAASRLTGADQWLAIGRNFFGICCADESMESVS